MIPPYDGRSGTLVVAVATCHFRSKSATPVWARRYGIHGRSDHSPPGTYAVSVPMPGHPDFHAVVHLDPGGRQTLDVGSMLAGSHDTARRLLNPPDSVPAAQ